MLTIKKGDIITKVSRQSYEKIFKRKGYKVIGDDAPKTEAAQKSKQEPEAEAVTEVEQHVDVETEQHVNVDEIPVSEMTKEQLAEFATKHGIDTSSARNVREARQAVQKWIRDNKVKAQ